MEPNPYEAPRRNGYKPPINPLPVKESAILFTLAGCGVLLMAMVALSILPEKLLGISKLWVVCTVYTVVIGTLWILLLLGRAAGILARPLPRTKH